MSGDVAEMILDEITKLRQEVAELRNRETFDTAGAAAYLNCSIGTIRRMVNEGALIPIRAGADFRFRKCDLDDNRVQTRAARASAIVKTITGKKKTKTATG